MKTNMRAQNLVNLVNEELSGQNAKEHIEQIIQHYRSPGSSGFHQATDYIIKKFTESNFDLHIEKYPLDGKRKVLGRTYSYVWEPISAKLKLISPVEEDLITFEKVPSCLPWWSGSTPPEGIMAELIDVGSGDAPAHYEDKDVRGKVVLVGSTPNFSSFREAWRLAVEEYGAIGIITDIMLYQAPPLKTRHTVPDLVQLLRISPPKMRDQWAISISHTIGERLRGLLSKGPVKIWTQIQAKTFIGEGKNLTVTIPGTDTTDEELLFISHTSAGTKPGATCAAGPSLMFEIARTIKTLIDTGKIPRPRRSIKFQIGPEGNVSYEYLNKNRERLKNITAAFCLDSVGHNQHKLKSALLMCRNPDSLPHFINDFVSSMIETSPKETQWFFSKRNIVPLINFTDVPYTTWSDNHNLVSYGVPCPLFMSIPDLYFHSQLLTADIIDPAVLKRCGLVLTVAALILANAGLNEAVSITKDVAARSEFRLSQSSINAFDTVTRLIADTRHENNLSDAIKHRLNAKINRSSKELAYIVNRDLQVIDSVQYLIQYDSESVKQQVCQLADTLKEQLKQKLCTETKMLQQFVDVTSTTSPIEEPDLPFDFKTIIPKKRIISSGLGFPLPGMTYMDHVRLTNEIAKKDPQINFTSLRIVGDELWNFMDDTRSLQDIAESVQFEFNFDIDLIHFAEMFSTLEKSGYIELINKD